MNKSTPSFNASMERYMSRRDDPKRVPQPSHRHAAPSAPWPWMDIDDEVDREQLDVDDEPIPDLCTHETCGGCWLGYPQSRFPNWTSRQVKKSKIWRAIYNYDKERPCRLYQVDVDSEGIFQNAGTLELVQGRDEEEDMQSRKELWDIFLTAPRPVQNRVRVMFIEHLSGPVLQMLGTIYNIEPFFWSSSLNWIPCRFQEEVQPGIGDHITITLSFLRSKSDHEAHNLGAGMHHSNASSVTVPSTLLGSQSIDTHLPLKLHSSNRLLVQDLLSVHLIRNIHGSTMISYHPSLDLPTTDARFLHERIRFAGQSVYWQSMFQKTPDPTFVLLVFIWHAMYAWDEALENLYTHICGLEGRVIDTTNMHLTRELHLIRAHHLHYASLLDDYSKHIDFILHTPNPALSSYTHEEREFSKMVMKRECENLQSEVKRLRGSLMMQERRLKNVMGLVFSFVNITDSQHMRDMTEAAVRDSAAMKQVAYLTMFFMPASFVAGVFGMNVAEINPGTNGTIWKYISLALPLTLITVWIIIAFQCTYLFEKETTFFKRLGWPVYMVKSVLEARRKRQEEEEKKRSSGDTRRPSGDSVLPQKYSVESKGTDVY